MRINSPGFEDGQVIPKQYTEDGNNISPPLRLSDVPDGAKEFALIVDDPDAPRDEPFVHWVMYGIPADVREVPEALPSDGRLNQLGGARQGDNSFRNKRLGYRGPAPPPGHGTHHYRFHVYALDQPLELAPRVDKDGLRQAMDGHIIDEAELVGTYQR